ncbi:hypothetical protein DL240_00095 [Lujinxingia litoralis]|uniref:Uncharacterized protein n=1 Tax=Lujinxingia litoralis TaxID=2211119 RepID=A0A328C899_9DELT|nr:hypothetical protein [Lujinxingia litoralis]RAL24645.1 hypothetical protein DL240_00095 [Lujinxingia litoralis]
MKVNDTLKLLMVLLVSAGMATSTLTACGGDSDSNTDVETDAGDNDTGGEDSGDVEEDGGDGPGDGVDIAPPPPRCGEEGASERCDADPETFEFGTASKISELKIADDTCCYDFDDNNNIDNALGGLANLIPNGGVDVANDAIAEGIADGSISLVLEHDGLTALEAGQNFNINFMLGAQSTENGELIDPASFDQGTAPQAVLPNATIIDDGGIPVVEAGPGTVVIVLEFFGLELALSVRNATIEADVVAEESSLEEGVTLENGRLGGLIIFEELIDEVNKVGANCGCLGNPETLVDLVALDNGEPACPEFSEAQLDSCVDDEAICGDIAGFCGTIPLVSSLADIDIDGDGDADAFSAGLTFSAVPAVIAGVEAEAAAE